MTDSVIKIAATGVCVALCLAVDIGLDTIGIKTPYLTFLPAVVGSSLLAGFGSALWATLLSSLGLWYFFLPADRLGLPTYSDIAHLGVFAGVALFIAWVIDGLRRSNAALARDNVVLGCKISTLLHRSRAS
jgi:K+-sensing histidine kinase KdpD